MASQDEVLRMVAELVDRVSGPLARIGAALKAVGRATGVSQIHAAFTRLSPVITRVGSLIRSSIGGALTAIGQIAPVVGAAIGAALGFGAKGVIDTAAEFEKFEATLTTIEGSSEKAKKSMAWISNFAKTTPYEVSEITANFVKLKSYGLDPLDGTLSTLGDTASAMGKSLSDATEMWADAASGEFERLKEFGVRASSAKDKVTFTWQQGGKELSKTMKKSGKEITGFLKTMFGNKFRGAMVRQSKTWNGMTSNMADTWSDFQRRIADAGFFNAMKTRLADALDLLGEWANDGTLDQIATMISNGLTAAADVVGAVIERIATHVKFLSQNFEAAKPYIKGVAIALGALVAIAFPMVTAFAVAAVALDDFFTYLEGGESITGAALQWLGNLAHQITAILPGSFSEAMDMVTNAINSVDWGNLGQTIARMLVEGIKAIASLIGDVWSLISASAEANGGWGEVGGKIMAAIVAGLKAWAQFLFAFWTEIGGEIVNMWLSLGARMGSAILKGLKSMGAAIRDWFASLIPDWAKGIFTAGPAAAEQRATTNPGVGVGRPLPPGIGAAPGKQSALPSSILSKTADAGGVANGQTVKGEGKITVDFKNMPTGVNTSGETKGGLFKSIALNRGPAMAGG